MANHKTSGECVCELLENKIEQIFVEFCSSECFRWTSDNQIIDFTDTDSS